MAFFISATLTALYSLPPLNKGSLKETPESHIVLLTIGKSIVALIGGVITTGVRGVS